MKKEIVITDCVIFILLACAIIGRLSLSEEHTGYIAGLNFLSMVISIGSLLLNIRPEIVNDRVRNAYAFFMVLILFALLIVAGMIMISLIIPTAVFNDVVTLLALLFATPQRTIVGISVRLINTIKPNKYD